MSQLDNLKAFDPFADASKGDEESGQEGVVHIRIQQRNGRKTLTTVQVRVSALCFIVFCSTICFAGPLCGVRLQEDREGGEEGVRL